MRRLLLLPTLLVLAVPAPAVAAKLTAKTAATAIERKVASKYQRTIRGRSVVAECKRRSAREYFCNYGVLGNFRDGVENSSGSSYVFSNVGWVRRSGSGRLVADPLPPRRGDAYAPRGKAPKLTEAQARVWARREVELGREDATIKIACSPDGPQRFRCRWVAFDPAQCGTPEGSAERGVVVVAQRRATRPAVTGDSTGRMESCAAGPPSP